MLIKNHSFSEGGGEFAKVFANLVLGGGHLVPLNCWDQLSSLGEGPHLVDSSIARVAMGKRELALLLPGGCAIMEGWS